jgi:hypothetical protein
LNFFLRSAFLVESLLLQSNKEAFMSYAESIRDYVSNVPLDTIISTREVLHLGTRSAVDQTLYRLVKATTLIRLTPGLFIRAGSTIPASLVIVKAKAAAFGRAIATHGSILAHNFGLIGKEDALPTFCISGGSSSFNSLHGQTNFVGTCDRKRHLGESTEGRTIRAFWHLRRDTFEEIGKTLIGTLAPYERASVARQAAWMPAWMSDLFIQ